jgi:mannose-6-phosphate isomerase-like protein (cupin superfamily)
MASADDELFAAPLAGSMIASAQASLVLAEWKDPGGAHDPPRFTAPLHVHHDDDEAWYVLEGALRVRLGDRDIDVPAGGAVLAPRGTPHTYWNPQPGPARYVLVMTPRIRSLIDALHALPNRDEQTVTATFAEYGSEYLGWP